MTGEAIVDDLDELGWIEASGEELTGDGGGGPMARAGGELNTVGVGHREPGGPGPAARPGDDAAGYLHDAV
jgi:hypothetical protein